MTERGTRLLKNLAVSAVTSLLCFAAAEVTLRVVAPVQTFVNPLRSFHQYDPELGWTGTPNLKARFRQVDFDVLVRTDANGFREKLSTNPPALDSPLERFKLNCGHNNLGKPLCFRLNCGLSAATLMVKML